MEKNRISELTALASEVRKDIVRMVGVARSGPLEAPLSISDLLVYIYWEELAAGRDASSGRHKPRDRFLLGMGDGTPALYAVLARKGYFVREELWNYRRLGAMLQALPDYRRTPGIDAPCITTGTELAVASSIAESLPADGSRSRALCLIGHESFCNPDFLLEAERIGNLSLGNLIVLIAEDFGGKALLNFPSSSDRMAELGWKVYSADGHDFDDIKTVFEGIKSDSCAPSAVFIKLESGTSLSFVRSDGSKNTGFLSTDDMDQALEELEGKI